MGGAMNHPRETNGETNDELRARCNAAEAERDAAKQEVLELVDALLGVRDHVHDASGDDGEGYADYEGIKAVLSSVNIDGRSAGQYGYDAALLRTERDAAVAQKNSAYSERDRLVQALSKLFPSFLARHPDSDTEWDDDWRWIVFIELPTGQASWHIHDSERAWFEHLSVRDSNPWDGHTTEEKYRRLSLIAAAPPADKAAEDPHDLKHDGSCEDWCRACRR